MKIERPIRIALVLLAMQLPAFSAEVAVLRNGFSLRFERKEQVGDVTRLYTKTGFIEVATSEIASFEPDDTPDVTAPPAVSAQNAQPSQVAIATNQPSAANQFPAAAPGKAATRADLDLMVREASTRNRLDPDFVNSVIKAESNFQTRAVSRKGAQGLMQLMPGTAAQLGVKDAFDPKANVEAGTAHLSALLDLYHDDTLKALAAYNAGAHRVDQYHGVPPYRETRAYVASIVRDFNAKKRAQMKTQAAANHTSAANHKKTTGKKTVPAKPQAAAVKPQKPA
ncbi:MAG TPA: lytic transglycosylase domain-containing protein [Candidatus Angelobacter sp.]|nr:lytic transglycosylase domain-containing protein [Candidatus Angelobacter sp.]